MEVIEDLAQLANQVMKERGLKPDFSAQEIQQLELINQPASATAETVDLRSLLWCSIDNDDSRDLDQLTYAEKDKESYLFWIAVADVSSLVKKNTPIDRHAQINTTSVYTPAKIFPMLPEKLSTDLTSLNENEDRMAMVVKILMNKTGEIENFTIFPAIVHNHAKLAYNAVGDWLEGKSNAPDKVKNSPKLEETLRLQHEIAQMLKESRHEAGSLTLISSEPKVKVESDNHIVIQPSYQNFAQQLIEEFMIAANRAMAQSFSKAKLPNLRRVVRIPKYWDRIVEVAKDLGEILPSKPDSKALDLFLIKRKKVDPESFPDLSLTIIKLLGSGEYVVETDADSHLGHFGLALSDYTHSTAPNRRFPDLISQRQYKAFLSGEAPPYTLDELKRLAIQCSKQEDAAKKVQRQLNKSAAAAVLSSQIGTVFKGIITGSNEKGVWVRIFNPPVEGKVVSALKKLEVGDRVTIKLKSVDVAKGFIDFILLT